ncbi:MAG: EI24 domain-containing protein [Betaproteobacteria bacterium]|nr:EI24 domain-containing protein [Betaproteobacteria bacterium]
MSVLNEGDGSMRGIASSLGFALGNVLHPRMLWLMAWPVLAALALWGAVAFVFWAQFVLWLAEVMRGWIAQAGFFASWDLRDVALFAAKAVVLLSFVPLVQLTALLLLSAAGMSAIVGHVAARRYPALARRHGGSLAGGVWNTLVALAGMSVLGLLSLPLWLFAPLWPLIPLAIMGWVNQRVLRYDALAEHASAAEARAIVRRERGALYAMGVVLALLAYVPLLGFFAPVVCGLAMSDFLLARLHALRAPAVTVAGDPS